MCYKKKLFTVCHDHKIRKLLFLEKGKHKGSMLVLIAYCSVFHPREKLEQKSASDLREY